MFYTIEFTQSYYKRRRIRNYCLGFVAFIVLMFVSIQVREMYLAWSKPTLAMHMAEYHASALKVEDVVKRWNACSANYGMIAPYYRVFWSENASNILACLVERQATLPRTLMPQSWRFRVPGKSELVYELTFTPQSLKRLQISAATNALAMALAPWHPVVSWREQDMAKLTELQLTVRVQLNPPPHDAFPGLPPTIGKIGKFINERRELCMNYVIEDDNNKTARVMLAKALSEAMPALMSHDSNAARVWPELLSQTIDPVAFIDQLEGRFREINSPKLQSLVETRARWAGLANRQWRRVRALDSAALDAEIEEIRRVFLPPLSLFLAMDVRTAQLRAALTNGLSEREVFDEGRVDELIKADVANLKAQLAVKRVPEVGGLILAPWTFELAPDEKRSVSPGGVDGVLRAVVDHLNSIVSSSEGFVVKEIEFQFESSRDGAIISHVLASGLLPCRAEPKPQGGR